MLTPPAPPPPSSFRGQVHAVNVTDLVIEGEGGIDGNGSCFWLANHARGHHSVLDNNNAKPAA